MSATNNPILRGRPHTSNPGTPGSSFFNASSPLSSMRKRKASELYTGYGTTSGDGSKTISRGVESVTPAMKRFSNSSVPPGLARAVSGGLALPPESRMEMSSSYYSQYFINVPMARRPMVNRERDPMIVNQVLFVKKDNDISGLENYFYRTDMDRMFEKSIAAAAMPQKVMLTIQELNSYLRRERTTRSPNRLLTAHDVAREWSLGGVVAHQYGGDNELRIDTPGLKKVQSVTMTVRGMASVQNYWGDLLFTTTHLYFIVVRVDGRKLPSDYVVDPQDASGVALEGDRRMYVRNPLQFVPWSSPRGEAPSIDDLTYVNDFGREEIGTYVKFGWVDERKGTSHSSPLVNAHNASAIITQPLITVCVNIRGASFV